MEAGGGGALFPSGGPKIKAKGKFQELDDQNSLECDYLASPFWSVFDFISNAIPFIVY